MTPEMLYPLAPEASLVLAPEDHPCLDDLEMEDGKPLDSMFQEKLHRLLTESLFASWGGPGEGRPFLVLSNVGLFYAVKSPPLVPDVMLRLDVKQNRDLSLKENQSYLVWIVGKPLDFSERRKVAQNNLQRKVRTMAAQSDMKLLYQAADMVVDPATNRLYVADGYGNRRVLIVDANTGKYIGHFGAYGNNPVDDGAAKAAGPWIAGYSKGIKKPAFFRNPVHCVKIANDGKIYVCDRGNDRIQVFDKNDPALGAPCSNPTGEAGKCGFIAEQFISEHTNIIGTAVSMSFSTDKAQSCLYVGDNANMTIYILKRSNLQELGRLGRSGRMSGEFHYLHQVSVDSKGNIYTAEVDTAKRIQKFLRYGGTGCSGTGSPTVGGVVTAK